MTDVTSAFFDIDGTLVSYRTHTMPQSTRDSLEVLRSQGIKLFIATSRAPTQIESIQSTLDFHFDGYVTMNGQYCFDDEGFKAELSLDKTDVQALVEYSYMHPDVCFALAEADYSYFNFVSDYVRDAYRRISGKDGAFDVEPIERALQYSLPIK